MALPNDANTAAPTGQARKIVVDTDMGVDDAAGVAWLLAQTDYPVEILGLTAVAGNTAVENAARNILTVLAAAGHPTVPVVIGAAGPLVQPRSHAPALIHGPDGLWFAGAGLAHDLSALSRDVPGFYRNVVAAHTDVTLVTLGPLTNLARTLEQAPEALRGFAEIVVLGGAQHGGNISPVAEFNIWQDPEAAQAVFAANLPITLVGLDVFDTFRYGPADVQALQQAASPLARLLAGPLQTYLQVEMGVTGRADTSLPDVVAVIYALDPALGTAQPGLVEVIAAPNLARGLTVMGLAPGQKVPMIATADEMSALADQALADPTFDMFAAMGAILARRPDNARIVTAIQAEAMQARFLRALTAQ